MASDDIILSGSGGGEAAPDIADIPETIAMLPVRDVVVFPYMILPLFVGRDRSISAVEEALANGRMIYLSTQKDMMVEEPEEEDLHEMGTVALIMRMLKLPDGRVKILVQGLSRARRLENLARHPHIRARIAVVPEEESDKPDFESEALVRSVHEKLEAVIEHGKGISTEIMMVLETVDEVGRLADIIAANLNLKVSDAVDVLSETDPADRLELIHQLLDRELQVLEVQNKIKSAAKEEMSRSQREYFLRQQMKAIQEELGMGDEQSEELAKVEESIEKAKMTPEAKEAARK